MAEYFEAGMDVEKFFHAGCGFGLTLGLPERIRNRILFI